MKGVKILVERKACPILIIISPIPTLTRRWVEWTMESHHPYHTSENAFSFFLVGEQSPINIVLPCRQDSIVSSANRVPNPNTLILLYYSFTQPTFFERGGGGSGRDQLARKHFSFLFHFFTCTHLPILTSPNFTAPIRWLSG